MMQLSIWTLSSSLAFALSVFIVPTLFRSKIIDNELSGIERYRYLDALRGIVACMVFVHHSRMIYNFYHSGTFGPAGLFNYSSDIIKMFYTHFGQTAVMIFFTITGFLFFDKLLSSRTDLNLIDFFSKRIKRLMPAIISCFILAIAVSTIITGKAPSINMGTIISWLSMGFFIPQSFNETPGWVLVCGVFWTLAIEVKFYILVPLVSCFTSKQNKTLYFLGFYLLLTLASLFYELIDMKTASILLCFLGGFTVAYSRLIIPPAMVRFLKTPAYAIFALVLLAFSWSQLVTSYTIYIIPAITLLLAAVIYNNSFLGVLELRFLKLSGKVSYSIYIMHGLALNITIGYLTPNAGYLVAFISSSALVMALSLFNYFLVEKKGMLASPRIANV